MVDAIKPVVSFKRFAARPVGAHNRIGKSSSSSYSDNSIGASVSLKYKFTIPLMTVVLPVPGPPDKMTME